MTDLRSRKALLGSKLHRIVEFLTNQGITMAGNLLYGLLCVRLLPIAEYAKFAVVFGFLGTLVVLMDIGFSSTLLPLVGERVDDCQLIADYVASLRQLAHWLYVLVGPALVILYPLLVRKQQWSWPVVAAMVCILLVASWSARVSGAYGAVLIVRRDRTVWYRAQMISSLGTLALLGVFWAVHLLNAFSAILLNVAGIVFIAFAYFLRARRLLGVSGRPSPKKRREIIHLTLPSMPNVIFYALQGQISLLLIAVFGHTAAVAGIGALSRLGQAFVLFSQMTPLLIEPYFASLAASRLKRSYLGVMLAQGALCLLVTGLAAYFPEVFLWVLGPKYANLRYEVFLAMATNSMGYLAGVLWAIHGSRRFVYWWNGMAVILYSLLADVLFLLRGNLSTMRGVLYLGVALSSGSLAIQILAGLWGFIYGPRKVVEPEIALS